MYRVIELPYHRGGRVWQHVELRLVLVVASNYGFPGEFLRNLHRIVSASTFAITSGAVCECQPVTLHHFSFRFDREAEQVDRADAFRLRFATPTVAAHRQRYAALIQRAIATSTAASNSIRCVTSSKSPDGSAVRAANRVDHNHNRSLENELSS